MKETKRNKPKVIITDNRDTYASNKIEQVLISPSNESIFLLTIFLITKSLDFMLLWLKERLTEKSTYQGIIGLLGAVGMTVNPEMIESVVALAVSLISVIEITRKENGKEKASK
jgi:hypothetical protein